MKSVEITFNYLMMVIQLEKYLKCHQEKRLKIRVFI